MVVWPRDGATDVGRDTPLVVLHYDPSNPPGRFEHVLTDGDGNEIALAEIERLPLEGRGCGHVETVFLRPTDLLDAGASYTLSVSGFESEDSPAAVTFTVGAGTFEPAPLDEVEIRYLHVAPATACVVAGCEIAEIDIDLGAPVQEPRWLVVNSGAVEDGTNTWQFFPDAWKPVADNFDREARLSVELPNGGDRCVQIQLYGLDGSKLLDEQRCEPDRCARTDLRSESSCGGPSGSGLDPARIPEGTCEDPPVIEWAAGVGPVYPDEQKQDGSDEQKQDGSRGSGCSAVQADVSAAGATNPSLALAIGAVWLARRRKRI